MNQVQQFTQAYSQAPWRKQLQWVGLFLLVLIVIAMVAGIYLRISAETSAIGRSIQVMYSDMEGVRRNIEDLETQLAYLNSNATMTSRAEELGFQAVTPGDILYISIPGYARPEQVTLAGSSEQNLPRVKVIAEEYTQSLFDWLRERIFEPAAPLIPEVQP